MTENIFFRKGEIMESRKTAAKNHWEEYMYEYSPEKIKSRVHNHDLHKDSVEEISALEREALDFLKSDCRCYDETDRSYDENLMCLYHGIHRFMETGSREDAFDIYYCYIYMFFQGKNRKKAEKLLEMLSDFENNASNLVLKHRDHYSHSVYVFLIGLAIYHNNENYRKEYGKAYFDAEECDEKKALHFLRFWGLSALFHDVGYPFEIPFEQIKSYFKISANADVKNGKLPFLAYQQPEYLFDLKRLLSENGVKAEGAEYAAIVDELTDCRKYGEEFKNAEEVSAGSESEESKDSSVKNVTTADVIAAHINRRLKDRQYPEVIYGDTYISNILKKKPVEPNEFDYFMDHALFSSTIMYRELMSIYGVDEILKDYREDKKIYYGIMDALTAIVMHNSLFKFCLRTVAKSNAPGAEKYKEPIKIAEHPLAYLLMFCDELQCWNRTSFGRSSKQELHAWNCIFDFSKENRIEATYLFDAKENDVRINNEGDIEFVRNGTLAKFLTIGEEFLKQKGSYEPKNGEPETWETAIDSYQAKNCKFYRDIEEIVNLTDLTPGGENGLFVAARISAENRFKPGSLSEVRLINLYHLAEELFNRTSDDAIFEKLSLAEQLSYIQTVKKSAEYLDDIGVFFTDEPKNFSERHFSEFTRMEKRYLILKEMERMKSEDIQMFRGGVTDEYLKYINEYPERAAEYFRNEQAYLLEKKKENSDGESVAAQTAKKIGMLLKILDWEYNIYFYPGRTYYDIDYKKETAEKILRQLENEETVNYCPDVLMKMDLYGRIVKEYSRDELYYEEAVDGLMTGAEDLEMAKLYLVHIRSLYKEYALSDANDDDGIYYYNLDRDGKKCILQVDSVDRYDLDGCLFAETLKIVNGDENDMEMKYEKNRIDRTMYYFTKTKDGLTDYTKLYLRIIPEEDYSRIGFEQLMEGCQDMRSFFISKLGLEEIY